MSVEWSETATDQLRAIRDYLARSSPGYARSLVSRIIARTDQLANQPLLGTEVVEYGVPDIREVHEHPYRIIYRVNNDKVQIISIIHAARRLPRTL